MSARTGRVRRAVGTALVDTSPLRRHAGFRHLWTGQLVASLGSQLTVVAVGIQTYQLTGSTAMVGLVSLGQLVPLLAGSLFGGPFVDAWDRRRVLMATQVLLAAGAAGLAGPQFAAWSGGLLSVVSAVVTCWAIPQFWRYRSQPGPTPSASEAVNEGQVAEG